MSTPSVNVHHLREWVGKSEAREAGSPGLPLLLFQRHLTATINPLAMAIPCRRYDTGFTFSRVRVARVDFGSSYTECTENNCYSGAAAVA
jgi:hypothetical protein